MRFFKHTAILMSTAMLIISCAEDQTTDSDLIEQASLDAWIARYDPNAIPFGDMYYHLIPGNIADANSVRDGDWVKVDVIGRNLEGSVFYNSSDSMLAKKLGTFTRRTHYIPKQGLMASNSAFANGLTVGQMNMLLNMKEGDSCRVYMPSKLAYQGTVTSASNGYGGNVHLGARKPAVFDMKVTKVIKSDIADYEQDGVRKKAQEWGVNLADTVRGDLIYLKSLGFKSIDPSDNTGQSITIDSTFYYYFTIRFLDDFAISTNIDSVAKQSWGVSSSIGYNPVLFDKSSDQVAKVLLQVSEFGNIHYGQIFKIAYTSKYGYAAAGYPGSATTPPVMPYTVIEPYTPLIMEVYVVPKVPELAEIK